MQRPGAGSTRADPAKARRGRVLLLALGIAAALGGLSILRQVAFRPFAPRSIRVFFELFWPPPDLHQPIFEGPIDLLSASPFTAFSLTAKYPGSYSFDLRLERKLGNPLDFSLTSLPALGMAWVSPTAGAPHFRSLPTPPPYWGKDENGFTFFVLDCPREFPAKVPLSFTLWVERSDRALWKTFGKTTLVVRRASDL